jgi:hypothetical protein
MPSFDHINFKSVWKFQINWKTHCASGLAHESVPCLLRHATPVYHHRWPPATTLLLPAPPLAATHRKGFKPHALSLSLSRNGVEFLPYLKLESSSFLPL